MDMKKEKKNKAYQLKAALKNMKPATWWAKARVIGEIGGDV